MDPGQARSSALRDCTQADRAARGVAFKRAREVAICRWPSSAQNTARAHLFLTSPDAETV
ncbi:MAG: hypothetical protein CVU19_07810 [Betaproteobacteria bacterium HGW-Betaproteobacteria-13]|jgi:hypothetical protein|nr:MAG: hypothetical protein CVU19_07810 [Betaproteobacteria bacterium HGW-Betaproteobacteria-13]